MEYNMQGLPGFVSAVNQAAASMKYKVSRNTLKQQPKPHEGQLQRLEQLHPLLDGQLSTEMTTTPHMANQEVGHSMNHSQRRQSCFHLAYSWQNLQSSTQTAFGHIE